MKPWKRKIVLALYLVVLILPLIPLLLWSVSLRWDFPALLPDFDLWAWKEIRSEKIIDAIYASVPISVSVVLISLVLSFFPAKLIGTARFRGRSAVELLLLIPIFIPQISVVFGMQNVFRRLGIYSTLPGVIIAQLVFHVPYMTLLLSAVFRAYDPAYEQQAASLGVGPMKTMLHVTLPAVMPGVVVSCVFSFIGSWGTYLVTAVIGPAKLKTLPLLLFPMMSSGNNSYPLIAAITIVYIAPVLLFLIISSGMLGSDNTSMGGRVL